MFLKELEGGGACWRCRECMHTTARRARTGNIGPGGIFFFSLLIFNDDSCSAVASFLLLLPFRLYIEKRIEIQIWREGESICNGNVYV